MGSRADTPLPPSLPLPLGKKGPLDGLKALIQAWATPTPPTTPQHPSGGQNTKCQEGRRRGCELTGGAQAPLGEPRPEASAGMGLRGVCEPDKRLCSHAVIPEFLTPL